MISNKTFKRSNCARQSVSHWWTGREVSAANRNESNYGRLKAGFRLRSYSPCIQPVNIDRSLATIWWLVEVLLYVHRSRRFIRDGSPGPRLQHSSWALKQISLASRPQLLSSVQMVVKCCLMSSDISWHIIRDKLWPMPKHGSINLYVHGNQKARWDGQPRTATSTLTQLLNYVQMVVRLKAFENRTVGGGA